MFSSIAEIGNWGEKEGEEKDTGRGEGKGKG